MSTKTTLSTQVRRDLRPRSSAFLRTGSVKETNDYVVSHALFVHVIGYDVSSIARRKWLTQDR
jgi:hypothetical protein